MEPQLTPTGPAKHIFHGYDKQMTALAGSVESMVKLVCTQVELSVTALHKPSADLVKIAKSCDREINALEMQVEEQVTHLLITHRPLADDLRRITSSLRIAIELERAGDHAKNIIKRCAKLDTALPDDALEKFSELGREVSKLLNSALTAIRNTDAIQAKEIFKTDDEIDALYRTVTRMLLTQIEADPKHAESWTHAIFIAKFYERIADYANAIAKTVHYVQTGVMPRNVKA